ncbi:hypothetical protein [Arthrobacter sp. GAS37]|uniref:hypothetical protein n=1 Tax=Arthrobacter sp. GAS37 TaxID=3156261 RepID=UPI00384D2EFF
MVLAVDYHGWVSPGCPLVSRAGSGGEAIDIPPRATTDFRVQKICAAVIGPRAQPTAAVVGLPVAGRLRIVGRSTPLSAHAGRSLAMHLRASRGDHPWPEEITETMLDRFSKERGTVRLTLVEPLVVEVSADVAWSGRSFRHPVRLLRVRPELHPDEVSSPFDIP